jgi:hypothetical protein
MSFGITNHSMIFDILRSKMYSDPILAVVREISCNARDANVEAGKADIPINIHLPTKEDPNFEVSDSGLGISPDRMANIFINYGSSSKRGTNEQIGGFGLGAKSPFAYTDAFNLTTIHDGVKYEYAIFLDESRAGKVALLHSEPTTEPSGTKLSVPVDLKNIRDDAEVFRRHMISIVGGWDVQPITNAPHKFKPYSEVKLYENEFGYVIDSTGTEAEHHIRYGSWVCLMVSGIMYALPENCSRDISSRYFERYSRKVICLKVKTGEVELASNRESVAKSATGFIDQLHRNFCDALRRDSEKAMNAESLDDAIIECRKLALLGLSVRQLAEYFRFQRTDVSLNMLSILVNGYASDVYASRAFEEVNPKSGRKLKRFSHMKPSEIEESENKPNICRLLCNAGTRKSYHDDFQFRRWLKANPGKEAHLTSVALSDPATQKELTEYLLSKGYTEVDPSFFETVDVKETSKKLYYCVRETKLVRISKKEIDSDERIKVCLGVNSMSKSIRVEFVSKETKEPTTATIYLSGSNTQKILAAHSKTHLFLTSTEDIEDECQMTMEEFFQSLVESIDFDEQINILANKEVNKDLSNAARNNLSKLAALLPDNAVIQRCFNTISEIEGWTTIESLEEICSWVDFSSYTEKQNRMRSIRSQHSILLERYPLLWVRTFQSVYCRNEEELKDIIENRRKTPSSAALRQEGDVSLNSKSFSFYHHLFLAP